WRGLGRSLVVSRGVARCRRLLRPSFVLGGSPSSSSRYYSSPPLELRNGRSPSMEAVPVPPSPFHASPLSVWATIGGRTLVRSPRPLPPDGPTRWRTTESPIGRSSTEASSEPAR